MNALVGSLVMVFATFVTLCNAQCYVILTEKIPGESATECKDINGVTHQLNSEWKTENCEACSCGEDGIQCCNTARIPVGYNTIKCKRILNKETCSYTVVERENPEKSCFVNMWIM
ncbi:beta-microseminoprotein [Elephas maximus indicus]|uniref:beta-microseminoprotein n=1 Tax=Elephas maximus indicus TaxID=99487 RepID=UPI002115D13F|nr:beta-microseminoprotein [Elephas maximus indicus]